MNRKTYLIAIFLLVFICGAHTNPAHAAKVESNKLTAEDVEAFLEGVMPLQLEREDIAGAVVSIVKDGKLIFAKGYGFSDVQKRKPVSPELTLFRPGSISKLFIWTSVMQLVEQGKLDLDRDVQTYIDFKIPARFGKPVTMRNIMTHTSGWEETAKDLIVVDSTNTQAFDKYLKTHMPRQIFPPGDTSAYSNYATTLAGYIVERISGRKYSDYIHDFIFQPLGMNHSTFVQPLPKDLFPLMSLGYSLGSDQPKSFEFVNAAPAGALSSTGTDMAKFMIAHLQDGEYEGHQILKPETARLMHSRQWALHPETNGMALGFYEESRNGLRIIGHGGDTQYFHSDLHLIHDANVGFFISYNSAGKGEISGREAVWTKFLDRYFPYTPPVIKTQPTAKQHAAEVSGSYLVSRREESTMLGLLYKLLQTKVSALPDGDLVIADFKDFNGKPKHWREYEPYGYQEVNGQDKVFFIHRKGRNTELVIPYPFMSFVKVSFFQSALFYQLLLVVIAAILILTVLLWPIAAMIRRHYAQSLNLTPGDRRRRIWTRLICLWILIFLITFGVLVVQGFENLNIFSTKMDLVFRLLNIAGLIAVAGALFAIYNAFRTLRNTERRGWAKFTEMMIGIACIGFVWIMIAGRLLIFNLNY